jgi:hypothetical protein
MQAMVANAFQQLNEPISLEDRVVDVVEDVFKIVDGLQQEANEGDRDGDGKFPFDNEGQQPLGDTSFDDVQQEHNFDIVALEDAMEELYVGSKCTKLATIILFMNLCMVHKVTNRCADELFTLLQHHLLPEPNCLPTNYYATKALT